MPDIVINDIGSLFDAAVDAHLMDGPIIWFRGLKEEKYKLVPSAFRNGTKRRERNLALNFYKYARTRVRDCPPDDDYAGWLSLMQHYGLPTRLLDWSESILVAAFFATEAHKYEAYPDEWVIRNYHEITQAETEMASVIWALDPATLNATQIDDGNGERIILAPSNALVRTAASAVFHSESSSESTLAVFLNEVEGRMFAQQCAFTLHATGAPIETLPDTDRFLRRYVIPANRRKYLAASLRLLGIRQASLFPDLASLASDLKSRPELR